jgi:cytohesin
LIEHGADIKARDSADFTPIHLAALGCNEEMIRVLLEKGADVNAKSFEESGYTPLYSAISGGAPLSVVKLLVARGADVNARGSPDACAPLCLARKVGRKDIVEFLQSRGAH